MQMILLLLLTPLMAFAQEKCDPKVAEKDCYNLLCKTSAIKPIPLETSDLAAAFKNHPYEFPESFAKELERLGKLSDDVKSFSKSKLDAGISPYVSEILEKPFDLLPHLKAFFGGELKCIQKNLECDLVSNDLSAYPEGMKSLFKTLYNKSLVFNEGTTLSMDQKKILLLRIVGNNKVEQKKIKKLKTEADFFTYSMSATWIPEYKQKVASELKVFEKDLSDSLKLRAEDFMRIDLKGEGRIAYVKRTCQLGAFIQDTMEANGTVQKFNDVRDRVIDGFKTKFLPQLSVETAKELGNAITPETFVLIEAKANIYPATFSTKHDQGYTEPKNAAEFMNDLMLIDRAENVKCNPGGKLVSDHYQANQNKIYISKYVLTNSFPDILTHEMGHWLSGQLAAGKLSKHSGKKIMKVRKCITKFYDHKREPKYAIKLKGDKFRTEEDFADWFAAKAGLGESGVFCDLKKMVRSEETDNYLPNENDSHSNYLFRDINIRLNRGETLPQSCKDLVGSYPESKPQKCDL